MEKKALRAPGTTTRLIRADRVKPEKLEFLWLDKVPLGAVTLIGGRPGQGKSLFTTWLAAHVTQQLGQAVIMSNPEDQVAAVKVPRLIAAGADPRLVHFWPGKLKLPADVEELEQFVAFHGVTLVTIDPIAKHVTGRDPNVALEPLAEMAERQKVAVVGVHHLIKRLPRDAHPQEAFGGASGGWLGSVRFAHVLGPVGGVGEPETRFLAVAKANYTEDDAPAVEFTVDETEIELPTGGEASTARLLYVTDQALVNGSAVVQFRGTGKNTGSPEKKAVAMEFLALLLLKGPAQANDVFSKGEEVGVSKMTLRRAAAQLGVERAFTGPGGHWIWKLPDGHPLLRSVGPKASKPTQATVDEFIADVLGGDDDDDDE